MTESERLKTKTAIANVIATMSLNLWLRVSYIFIQNHSYTCTKLTPTLELQLRPVSNNVKVIDASTNAARYYEPYMYNNCKLS